MDQCIIMLLYVYILFCEGICDTNSFACIFVYFIIIFPTKYLNCQRNDHVSLTMPITCIPVLIGHEMSSIREINTQVLPNVLLWLYVSSKDTI